MFAPSLYQVYSLQIFNFMFAHSFSKDSLVLNPTTDTLLRVARVSQAIVNAVLGWWSALKKSLHLVYHAVVNLV